MLAQPETSPELVTVERAPVPRVRPVASLSRKLAISRWIALPLGCAAIAFFLGPSPVPETTHSAEVQIPAIAPAGSVESPNVAAQRFRAYVRKLDLGNETAIRDLVPTGKSSFRVEISSTGDGSHAELVLFGAFRRLRGFYGEMIRSEAAGLAWYRSQLEEEREFLRSQNFRSGRQSERNDALLDIDEELMASQRRLALLELAETEMVAGDEWIHQSGAAPGVWALQGFMAGLLIAGLAFAVEGRSTGRKVTPRRRRRMWRPVLGLVLLGLIVGVGFGLSYRGVPDERVRGGAAVRPARLADGQLPELPEASLFRVRRIAEARQDLGLEDLDAQFSGTLREATASGDALIEVFASHRTPDGLTKGLETLVSEWFDESRAAYERLRAVDEAYASGLRAEWSAIRESSRRRLDPQQGMRVLRQLAVAEVGIAPRLSHPPEVVLAPWIQEDRSWETHPATPYVVLLVAVLFFASLVLSMTGPWMSRTKTS
jgi:hypothetical protein